MDGIKKTYSAMVLLTIHEHSALTMSENPTKHPSSACPCPVHSFGQQLPSTCL